MLSRQKSSSLLSKIFPLELFSCRPLRIHVKERDMKMDEERETKEPPSSNSSSFADQIRPSDKGTPIDVFQLPASSGDGDSKSESGELTSSTPAISREFSRKWMAFDRENPYNAKTDEKIFSCGNWPFFTELSEVNMTEMAAKENKNDVLSSLQKTFVVSDATKLDCPIMFASDGFLLMTGYASEEVIGRNCRFLQGPETDKNEVAKIRDTIRKGNSYCGKLLNYKKDGTTFWIFLTIGPVKDRHGNIKQYIGMQVEISKSTQEKEKAIESIIEVQTVKRVRSYVQSERQDTNRKHEEQEIINPDYTLPKAVDDENICTRAHQNSQLDLINDLSYLNSYEDSSMKSGLSGLNSSTRFKERPQGSVVEVEHEEKTAVKTAILKSDIEFSGRKRHLKRERDIRRGIDLATTLERIEENFVITNPRLPDNPTIFASERFLDSTGYRREEVLGRNFWFLQGSETDQATVSKIRDAIEEQREITVQIINHTKSGKKIWNLFHLQPMFDQKGELQYFIGVQLDVKPSRDQWLEKIEHQSAKVKAIAEKIDKAVRELPDANLKPEDLWAIYSQPVLPRPHKKYSSSWIAIQKITSHGEEIGLHHFVPIKPLGFGDIGSVHLVELKGTGELFAMKVMEKSVILNRNKVHRACMEREIISLLDHPFLPTLYSSFQTPRHVCLITDFCAGGDLFSFLDKQPMKMFKEETARLYAAEIVVGLEYLHCLGIIYRDLKPENVLLQKDGHIVLTDFDLSVRTSQFKNMESPPPKMMRFRSKSLPVFVVEPVAQLNSFIGTEDYIAPEIITGAGHNSSIDWWTLGILLYEMLYGRTPFKGKNRQKTFTNVVFKDLTFPMSIHVSLAARQLIDALLQRDPTRRLGSSTGADEIKRHPFFRGINWPKIRSMTPPSSDAALQSIDRAPKTNDLKREDRELSHSKDTDIF